MPRLPQQFSVLHDQSFDPIYFMVHKPEIFSKFNGFQPELDDRLISFNVDMQRLPAIELKKTK